MNTPGEGLHPVSQFWKDFDLESRRSEYDATGLQIAEHQEESVQRRRALAEATQQFRKEASASVVSSVGSLLRQYQQEIDKLTKRAKFGERSFLDVYHVIYEAPDPSPILISALETTSKVTELEEEVKKQAAELAEYSAESQEIKNQDATIRRLEEKIRSLEHQLTNKDIHQAALKQEMEEKRQMEIQEREEAADKTLKEAAEKLETARRQHQESQDRLLQMQSEKEEMKVGHASELEMATIEIEKANERCLELEKQLHKISNTSPDQPLPNPGGQWTEWLKEMEEKEGTIRSLEERMEAMERNHDQEREISASAIQDLEISLKERTERLSVVQNELDGRPTKQQVEALKQQLSIVQAVEYNAEALPSAEAVEGLMLRKNRHLEHQLTLEKLEKSEMRQRLDDCQTLLSKSHRQIEEQQDLISKLEEDLLSAEKASRITDPSSEDADNHASVTTVLRNQRDRFRDRVQQLESKLLEIDRESKTLRDKADTLSGDNVALVERLRYVQGYRQDRADAAELEGGLTAEKKYSKAYEAKTDPFNAFRGRQRERRKREMSLPDRTLFLVGDLVFGNKYARLFVCLYLVLLHVLVMRMLFLNVTPTEA